MPSRTPNTVETLSEKQRRFVEAYMGEAAGNATKAAELAGYKGSYATIAAVARDNLRRPAIRAAIDQRAEEDPAVMTRKERQRFWTAVARGEIGTRKIAGDAEVVFPSEMKDRLKATELLGKSQGDFLERIELTGKDGGPVVTAGIDLTKLSLDELETLRQLRAKASE